MTSGAGSSRFTYFLWSISSLAISIAVFMAFELQRRGIIQNIPPFVLAVPILVVAHFSRKNYRVPTKEEKIDFQKKNGVRKYRNILNLRTASGIAIISAIALVVIDIVFSRSYLFDDAVFVIFVMLMFSGWVSGVCAEFTWRNGLEK